MTHMNPARMTCSQNILKSVPTEQIESLELTLQ